MNTLSLVTGANGHLVNSSTARWSSGSPELSAIYRSIGQAHPTACATNTLRRSRMATLPIVNPRLSSPMKFHYPRMVLFGLFALAAMGSASASQMSTSTPASATHVTAAQAPVQAVGNPWSTLASTAGKQPGPLLAHDDRYWHDGRWHDRRDDWRRDDWRRDQWRRDQWRREQARREAERHRDWERHQDRAMRHRYEDDRRYYRR